MRLNAPTPKYRFRKMRGLWFGILVTGLLVLHGAPAYADERILAFHSDVTVNADASLDVVETIRVRGESDRIIHGIYRDFPTVSHDRQGRNIKVGFDVSSVKLNGYEIPYSLKNIRFGTRVYMGDKGSPIGSDVFTFELAYHTTRQVGFFADYDEIYWNVTGNQWDFPIDQASAVIHLPVGARVTGQAVYTGFQGDKGADAHVEQLTDGALRYVTTRPLAMREGLTVAVAFPKGFVVQPKDNDVPVGVMLGAIALGSVAVWSIAGGAGLIVLAYFGWAWWRVGRDPQAQTIIPLFAPPEGVSPACAGAMVSKHEGSRGHRELSVGIIALAVKGALRIEKQEGDFVLIRGDATQALTPEELELQQALFVPSLGASLLNAFVDMPEGVVRFNRQYASVIASAQRRLHGKLESQITQKYYHNNWLYSVGGAVLAMGLLAMQALLDAGGSEDVGLLIPVVVLSCFAAVAGKTLFNHVAAGVRGRVKLLSKHLFSGLIGLLVAGGMGTMVVGLGMQELPMSLLMSGVLSSWIVVFAGSLLKAPTVEGRTLLDQLEGFRMYLATAEVHRLEFAHPPSMTPEVFEAYLPYAYALGVEQKWCDKFMAEIPQEQRHGYHPAWYAGHALSELSSGDLMSSLESNLSSTLSSGSRGGGSSGGGGGGGGGGGF